MKILMSIKPQFVEKIRRGEKKFEFRRVLPKYQAGDKVSSTGLMFVSKNS